jgi:hypothetical protein
LGGGGGAGNFSRRLWAEQQRLAESFWRADLGKKCFGESCSKRIKICTRQVVFSTYYQRWAVCKKISSANRKSTNMRT